MSTLNFLIPPAAKYGKSIRSVTKQYHKVNEGKSHIEAELVQALGTLYSICPKNRYAAELRPESSFVSKEVKEKQIDEFVESETVAARHRVVEAQAVVEREKDSVLRRAAADTTKIPFEEMLEAIEDSIDNVATSDEDDDDE